MKGENIVDFRSMVIRDFIEKYNGMELLKQYTPQIAKPLLIRPFYKKTLGEAFDICMNAKAVSPEAAAKVIAAVEAM